jgi:hypothetical protein
MAELVRTLATADRHIFIKGNVQMRQYKVVDYRNRYRNDPTCEIKHDTEKAFVVDKHKIDDQGNTHIRTMILNPRVFHEERIVNEQEAILLILKGIKVEEVVNERQ